MSRKTFAAKLLSLAIEIEETEKIYEFWRNQIIKKDLDISERIFETKEELNNKAVTALRALNSLIGNHDAMLGEVVKFDFDDETQKCERCETLSDELNEHDLCEKCELWVQKEKKAIEDTENSLNRNR